ncbi:hypothetical protein SUGI_0722780 [Cryptomeria japonica]|nr:hypothetical protein SUGI_0722780 [Cryptomeria japonica]
MKSNEEKLAKVKGTAEEDSGFRLEEFEAFIAEKYGAVLVEGVKKSLDYQEYHEPNNGMGLSLASLVMRQMKKVPFFDKSVWKATASVLLRVFQAVEEQVFLSNIHIPSSGGSLTETSNVEHVACNEVDEHLSGGGISSLNDTITPHTNYLLEDLQGQNSPAGGFDKMSNANTESSSLSGFGSPSSPTAFRIRASQK